MIRNIALGKGKASKGFVNTLHANEFGGVDTKPSGIGVGGPRQDGKYNYQQSAKLFRENLIVRRAVLYGAAQTRLLNWDLFATNSQGEKTKVERNYPYKILDFCNAQMSFRDLVAQHYADQKLYGNAFIVLEETPEKHSGLSEWSLFPLNPKYVEIVPDPETKVKWYVYRNGKDSFAYPEDRVIHSYDYASSNYYLGDKALDAADFDLQIETNAKKSNRNLQQQAAVISGVLSSKKKITTDELERLRREFNEQYAGTKNAYRVLVLEDDMEYTKLDSSIANSGITEVITAAQKNQAIAFGVPYQLLTGEVAEIDKLESYFWRTEMVPWALAFEDRITKKLCDPAVARITARSIVQKLAFKFRLHEIQALKREALDDMRVYTAALISGVNVPNEIRAKLGDDPYSDEASDFGTLPRPVYDNKMAPATAPGGGTADASPSLTLPGSEGGRDQTSTGEAQMLDTTGTRSASETKKADTNVMQALWNILNQEDK